MTQHARPTSRWRHFQNDRTVSFLLRSFVWVAIIVMLILPLMGERF